MTKVINGKMVKLYPVNLEKADSTLVGAMTGAMANGLENEAQKVHEVKRALWSAKRTYGRGGSIIAWVDGSVLAFIKGANINNESRWAAMRMA